MKKTLIAGLLLLGIITEGQRPAKEQERLDPIAGTVSDILRQFKLTISPSPHLTIAVVEFTDYQGRVSFPGQSAHRWPL